MKVTFKTITQEMFQLSVNEDQTILEVKEAIAKNRGSDACPVERQKLIYAGKILDDNVTLDSLDYDVKKVIILVLKGKKMSEVDNKNTKEESSYTAAKNRLSVSSISIKLQSTAISSKSNMPSTASSSATSGSTDISSSTSKVSTATSSGSRIPSSKTTSSTSTASTTSAVPESSAVLYAPLTTENEEKLNNLIGMGYPKSDALAALRAAFFDQGRAVEYLINGIPKTLSKNNSSIEASEDGENVGLDFLQHNAAFGQIRQMVQKNPEILSEVIQKIAALNPPLMSVIKKNEREFLELLNSDSPIVAAPSDSVNPQQQHGNGSGNVVGRREHIVEVTEEERDAINRIKDMGFPEQLVIEAYIACDKNEELAIDYIISRLNESNK